MKLLSVYLVFVTIFSGTWISSNIGNNLIVQFPTTPKIDNTIPDYTSYLSKNHNCDFSVDIHIIPELVFPKNDKEAADFLEVSVEKAKENGTFISSKKFILGKINGLEIKKYFIPKQTIKLIEANRIFFLNSKRYTLRCLYKIENESVCEKDCKRFFSSLKFNSN